MAEAKQKVIALGKNQLIMIIGSVVALGIVCAATVLMDADDGRWKPLVDTVLAYSWKVIVGVNGAGALVNAAGQIARRNQ